MVKFDQHIELENNDGNKSERGNYSYKYPRPALTADCVIFGFDGNGLKLLLIERGIEPYKGYWALPGGFMKMNETIDECARRELFEETGIKNVYLEQFRVFSSVDRDPRGRVVTVAFIALVRPSDYNVVGGDDAQNAYWFESKHLPPLAFDHREIVAAARAHLKDMIKVKPVAFSLLDELFTVDELRKVYEEINEKRYDRRNFQRKLVQSDIVDMVVESRPMTSCTPFDKEAVAGCQFIPNTNNISPGRKSKFFGLKNKLRHLINPEGKDDELIDEGPEDENEDGSIKDLFNY